MSNQQGNASASSTFGVVAILFLVAVVGWAATRLWELFVPAFLASQPPVQAAIIAGSVTLLVSVVTLTTSAKQQKQREIQSEHRKQKAEIYEQFIQFWFKVIAGGKYDNAEVEEKDIFNFVVQFSQRMIVWGSDEVIKQYIALRDSSGATGTLDAKQMMKAFEGLLYAMRKDLGHENKNLTERDLLRLFINDIDQALDQSA